MKITKYLAAGLLVAVQVDLASAQEFVPDRRVDIVAHTGPGGGGDVMARALQTMFQQEGMLPHGTEVVNKPSPTGAAAMGYLAQKAGDPYTISVFTSTWIIDPVLNAEAPISWKALTPLSRLLVEPALIMVRHESPYQKFEDFIADAKARPGQLIQAGGAFGSTTILKMVLEERLGTTWEFVPFPTGGERVAALLGGHADLLFLDTQEGVKHMEAGTMRAIAVHADERLSAYPDLPTLKELGYSVDLPQVRGIIGPPGLAPEVVAFWDETFAKLTSSESWKKYSDQTQTQMAFLPSTEVTAFLEEYTSRIRDILRENGIAVVEEKQ